MEVRLNGGESVAPQTMLDGLFGQGHMDGCVGGVGGEYHGEMNDDFVPIFWSRCRIPTSRSLRRHVSSGSLCPDDGSFEQFGPHLLNVVRNSQPPGRGAD